MIVAKKALFGIIDYDNCKADIMKYSDYQFVKIGKYQIWKRWYKKGFSIRLGTTKLAGFKYRNDAIFFIKSVLVE